MRYRVWLQAQGGERTVLDVEAEDAQEAVDLAAAEAAAKHFEGKYAADQYAVENMALS